MSRSDLQRKVYCAFHRSEHTEKVYQDMKELNTLMKVGMAVIAQKSRLTMLQSIMRLQKARRRKLVEV